MAGAPIRQSDRARRQECRAPSRRCRWATAPARPCHALRRIRYILREYSREVAWGCRITLTPTARTRSPSGKEAYGPRPPGRRLRVATLRDTALRTKEDHETEGASSP